jgi:hypothetical protein
MLKLNPSPTFKADVPLTEPGKAEPTIVKITFRYKTRKEVEEFGEAVKDLPVAKALAEVIADWEGIDAECNAENIAVLCENYLPAGLELLTAYYRELSISRVKN